MTTGLSNVATKKCRTRRILLTDQKSNASAAACEFAPKLATATLMIPDQIIGAAA
jgi:hypothetical protein